MRKAIEQDPFSLCGKGLLAFRVGFGVCMDGAWIDNRTQGVVDGSGMRLRVVRA